MTAATMPSIQRTYKIDSEIQKIYEIWAAANDVSRGDGVAMLIADRLRADGYIDDQDRPTKKIRAIID